MSVPTILVNVLRYYGCGCGCRLRSRSPFSCFLSIAALFVPASGASSRAGLSALEGASVHTLRHMFLTHHAAKGTDLIVTPILVAQVQVSSVLRGMPA